jgi:hypothetical protein
MNTRDQVMAPGIVLCPTCEERLRQPGPTGEARLWLSTSSIRLVDDPDAVLCPACEAQIVLLLKGPVSEHTH